MISKLKDRFSKTSDRNSDLGDTLQGGRVDRPFASLPYGASREEPINARWHHRTIFISDTHLGMRGCKSELLLDFLQNNVCDTLYLVGDIIDGWRLKRSWYWDETQDQVVHEILHKATNGTRVIYIPGNHDEVARPFSGLHFGGVDVQLEALHETPDGRKFLVTHGDQFDVVLRHDKFLAFVGDYAYSFALWINGHFNALRNLLSLPYWSLSAYLKLKVKNAVQLIGRYESILASAAAEQSVDGIICGHIHHAEIGQIGDILYCNDGDWVESCTALCERQNGELFIVNWEHERQAGLYKESELATAA